MKWALFGCGIFLLLGAGQALPGLVDGPLAEKRAVAPNNSVNLARTFKGGERACVIIVGDGASYLGLYAYDADGNCIARDDYGNFQTRDDAAVEWYPPQTGRYSIEIKNLGRRKDTFSMAVH
jgi:hypothetical protein